MIISREFRKSWDIQNNKECYQFVVSYVASDGSIKFMQYNLPDSELFEWDYAKRGDYYYPNYLSWDNKPVKQVKMKSQTLSKERYYQIIFDLIKNNPSVSDLFSLNYPDTYFWDIETDISDDGFPAPQQANMPITVMSWVKYPNIVVFGTKQLSPAEIYKIEQDIHEHCKNFKDSPKYNFEYRYYSNEYDMLTDFNVNYFAKAPAVTGWNILGFDYLYYYNRCDKFGIDLKCLSPTQKMFAYKNDNGDMLKLPKHKLIYDYLACYKKWDRTVEVKESNTLDFVGAATCGVKKVQHKLSLKDMWEQQPREYIFYNAIDSVLVEQIDKKIKTSKAMYGLAALTKAEIIEVFGTIASVEIVQNEYLYRMNKVIPLSTKKYEFREYEGAFVFKPEPSISKWVLGLDYASLYPSTIRQFNLSPETYLFKDKLYKPKSNEIKTSSNSLFKRDEEGFMPMLLSSFYDKRKQHKKSMKMYGNIASQLNEIYNERIKEHITNININGIDFNPYECSLEELQNKIDHYENLAASENDFQMAVKLFINSVYGCLGTRFYNLYNPDIAEAITLQGQDLIKYSAEKIDQYVSDYWHLHHDAHNKIAEYMKNQFDEFNVDKFLEKAKIKHNLLTTNQIGGDTDSCYISFNCMMQSCEIPEYMGSHFIYAVYIYSLKGYIEKFLEDYANAFNCPKNVEEFELEKVARTVIYVAKKNYVMDIAWKEGNVHIPPAKKIIYAGIDVVKGSTPPWCREKQKEFIAWLISRYNDGNKPSYAEIVAKVKEYRKLFELQNPDQIFKSISISDYEKFIYDDKNTLTYNAEIKTIPQHVDAAARYNHLLYTTAKKYLKKYNIIKSGDKVRLYYINEKECFGYLPNQYPIEFAPKPDYDVCFAKVMLAPINRIIECAGYKSIPQTLTYSVALW